MGVGSVGSVFEFGQAIPKFFGILPASSGRRLPRDIEIK